MRLVSLHAAIAAVCLLSTVGSARAAVTPEENVVVFARTFSDQLINRRIVYLRPRVLPATPAPALLLLPYRTGDPDDMADLDRKSVVEGKSGSVRGDIVGRRIINKKNKKHQT